MTIQLSRILVTGSNGFIGKNLRVRLSELEGIEVLRFERGDDQCKLQDLISRADAVVHLAGENRPDDQKAFEEVNEQLTAFLCQTILEEYRGNGRKVPLIFASSTQAEHDTPYGTSKRRAEEAVRSLAIESNCPCTIFRLPGVFGKWSRPNYNSVVATFCYNFARGLPIRIDDASAPLSLVYIDDVVSTFLSVLDAPPPGLQFANVQPQYELTVGGLAARIEAFERAREAQFTERVGIGLDRALYATFLSHLRPDQFTYEIEKHSDARGVFVEMLKTSDSGQFSYFTAHAGETRGGHYHHTKSEKFLVIKGSATFRFRHLVSGEDS